MTRAAPTRPLTPGELAWMLLLPTIAIAIPVVVLLAPPIGDVAFAPPPFHYWATELVVRKPTTQAGYVLIVGFVFAYALAVALVRGGDRLRGGPRRALVAGAQLALVAFLAVAWIAQRNVHVGSIRRLYFTLPTVVVAAAIAAALTLLLGGAPRSARVVGLRERLTRRSSRLERAACLAVAAVLTVVWLLPAIATDRSLSFETGEMISLGRFAFDEATSVLNGRSPLVDMVTYASLWPYVTAIPLRAFDGSYAAFSIIMATITGAALLAVYAVLRHVTRRAAAALALYVPFLATSLFIVNAVPIGAGSSRYYPADYFGVFPLRYAGPYLLAWLTARFLVGARPRRFGLELLFLAAGLVVLNNVDFGVAALGGSVAAVACTMRPFGRAQLLRLGRSLAVGLAGALAAVSLLTLIRAGSLPQLGLLVRYGRTFAAGGYGNLPLPGLGFHLVLTATFVAALAVAAARARAGDANRVLTGMLAWSGVFGLGASIYFYAYRSHPYSVIQLFSAWSLALVLLVVVVLGSGWRERRWPTLPEIAVLLGFGLVVCSVAQMPSPWNDLRRIRASLPIEPMRQPEFAAAVASVTVRGERVAILDATGHRIARDAGVVSVSPYTGLEQMGAREQMDDTLDLLEREGGRRVFLSTTAEVPRSVMAGAQAELRRRGYVVARRWPQVVELVRARG